MGRKVFNKSYWCLQTWVTKFWIMWTSDKIFLDKIPLMRRGYQVPPPTKQLFAVVTCREREKNQLSPLSDTAYPPFSRAGRMARSSWETQTYSVFLFYFWDYNSIIFLFPSFLPNLPTDSFLLAFKFMELYAFVYVWVFILIFLFHIVYYCLLVFLGCLGNHEAGCEDKQVERIWEELGEGKEYNSNTLYEKIIFLTWRCLDKTW